MNTFSLAILIAALSYSSLPSAHAMQSPLSGAWPRIVREPDARLPRPPEDSREYAQVVPKPRPEKESGAAGGEVEEPFHLTVPRLELDRETTGQAPWPPRKSETMEEEVAAPLVALLQSQDPEMRVRAIEGLAASDSYGALQWLLLSLADPAPEVRKAASEAVLQANPAWLTDSILGTLIAGSPETADAIDAVLPSLSKSIEPTLIRLFREPQHAEEHLTAMAYALGRIKSHEAIADLAERGRSNNPRLAQVCADALYEVGDEGAIRELTGLLDSPFVEVRRTALYGLIRLGGPEVQATLKDISSGKKTSNLQLRQEATALLAYVGDEKTIEYLVGLIRQQSGLGNAASFALQNLTGYRVGNRPYLWLEWWNELQEAKERNEEAAPPLIPAGQRGQFPGLPPVGIPPAEDQPVSQE